jgi:putative ABC transport system ATP-binding protein
MLATPSMISLRRVSRDYGTGEARVRALAALDLDIDAASFVAIMGASGSGKSTAMNILGCLDRPTEGDYFFNGLNVTGLSRDASALLRRNYLGFVFQGFNLLARTTALENVELPLVYRGLSRRERHSKSMAALHAVGLTGRENHTPGELSGGQQQRVAIARAIVSDPLVLLADEPTGNLDSERGHDIMRLLQKLNLERGITIIMVTHEAAMADYASRIVTFADGRLANDVHKVLV